MKHKEAVQYFHTIAFFFLVQIYCCFVLEALVKETRVQGNQTEQCPL